MIERLPLQLRSCLVSAPVALDHCGPDCLLAAAAPFSHVISGGLGLSRTPAGGALRGVLFATRQATLIKKKSAPPPSFGLVTGFSKETHRRALEMLREGTCEFVCRPRRECPCSFEFEQVKGAIAWTTSSMHSARLAELFPVSPLRTLEQAQAFIHAAWRALAELNRLGISHGDPAFYNFIASSPAILIDLDHCAYTGEPESEWDQFLFLFHAITPVLAEFLPPAEILSFAQSAMAGAAMFRHGDQSALIPMLSSVIEQNRSLQAARSLNMRSRALQIQVTETGSKLSVQLMRQQQVSHEMQQAAEERLRALQEAHEEMNMLRQAAADRLQAVEAAHEEMRVLRQALEETRAGLDRLRAAAKAP